MTVTGTETSTKDEAVAAAADVKDEAAGQAKAVGQDAKAGVTAVAETAKVQARDVGGQLQDHARTVMGDASSELESQLQDRLRRLAGAARERTGQLQVLAEGRTDDAGPAADWARTAAEQIERLADRAQELGPKGVADEAANFARRRPMVFLAGAAAAGFVVGRLVRNAGQGSGEANGSGSVDTLTSGGAAQAMPALPAEGTAIGGGVVPPVGALTGTGPTDV
jgi:hypothetical protein